MIGNTKFSIKRTLLVSFYIGAVIVWIFFLAGSFFVIRHEVDELFDGELSQLARVLMTLYTSGELIGETGGTETLVTAPPFEGDENYENKLVFQIWGENRNLLVRSSNAPVTPIASKLDQFDTLEVYGNKMRVYALSLPRFPYQVQVGQRFDLRSEIALEMLETFYFLVLFTFPLILLLITRGINRGLRPLNSIAQEVAQRSPGNLDPVRLENVPAEIQGLAREINNLLARLKQAFNTQRQFIADAAHELRTPLAGLKSQAQIAMADKSRVEKSLIRIVQGVDRTSRLADQLLSLSRLEVEKIDVKPQQVAIAGVLDDVRQDIEGIRKQKGIEIVTVFDSSLSVTTDRELLYILVRNLVENAIRYSGDNTQVCINLFKDQNNIKLEIIDNGPGIAEQNMERIFDRFYREVGATGIGSGLGLAIARRIAELLNIHMAVENRNSTHGLRIRLVFSRDFPGNCSLEHMYP